MSQRKAPPPFCACCLSLYLSLALSFFLSPLPSFLFSLLLSFFLFLSLTNLDFLYHQSPSEISLTICHLSSLGNSGSSSLLSLYFYSPSSLPHSFYSLSPCFTVSFSLLIVLFHFHFQTNQSIKLPNFICQKKTKV